MHFQKPQGNEQQLIDMFLPDDPNVVQKKMFGYPAAFVNGKMFMGTFGGQLVLKLAPDDFENFVKNLNGQQFVPVSNRPMTGFALVPEELIDNEPIMHEWVQKSLHFVENLPLKR